MKKETKNTEPIKAYKVFENDWTCKGFRFEMGKEFHFDGEIKICNSGFHACEKLADCFNYYEMMPYNKIAEVEILGKIERHGEDSKIVTDRIKIVREISFREMIEIIKSQAVNRSEAVNWSEAVNGSMFIDNCNGISHGLFCANIKSPYRIFNKEVTENRYDEVIKLIEKYRNGWIPETTNIKILYLKNGNDWVKTPIHKVEGLSKEESYKDMPVELIDYLKGLPEFDAEIFEQITGMKP